MDATHDENSFFFNTATAPKVKQAKAFIEAQMAAFRNAARTPQTAGLAEQIEKLAQLRDQGVLDSAEFAAAKAKLLAGS
jgi:dihydroorotase